MNDHADELNGGRSVDDQEVNGDLGKRSRTVSGRILQYAIEEKRRQTITIHERLRGVIRSIEGTDNTHITDSVLSDLATTAAHLKAVLQELQSLYEQDKYNDVEDKVPLTTYGLWLIIYPQ